jgi:cell division septation protein DedD
MSRHLAWILTATLALGACGAGDRKSEQDATISDPALQPAPVQPTPAPPVAVEEPAVTETPAVATTTTQPAERLYTVQIAAYLSADSASAMAARLAQRGLPIWTMEVRVGNRTYHRIRVGAHPRLGEMRKLGQQIATQYKQQVWVAPIDMSTQIPADAVEKTRALLAN